MNVNQVVIKVIGNYSYQTSRCLGEGVYGKVFEGIQKQTKQKVAIKKIDLATFTNDKYLENAIFSQIYLLKRFNHPNIVKFKDVLSSKNSLYIITQFCKNGDLKEVLKKKRFKEEEAFEVMKQILSGFSELVRERIVHRDLKPANILINQGVYKIGDFGFAKYVDNFGTQMLKSCVGSPIYMAPQILQRTPYTTKCDIWSIGVIFYEMIHNSPPWKAKDQNQLLKAIKNISISHILRKSTLGYKAIQFLKKTLAYSEQQRIGWTQLFQSYGPKSDKHYQSTQKNKASTKQKPRVVSANSSSNLSSQYGSQNSKLTPLTPINLSSNSINSIGPLNSPTISPERKRNLFPPSSQTHSNSNTRSQSTQAQKRPNQVDSVMRWHHFLIFYHFNCLQCFLHLPTIASFLPNKQQTFCSFLLTLSLLIKNRSTFCLSMLAIHTRTHRPSEQLYKQMKNEHQTYESVYNDIVAYLQKMGIYKALKAQISGVVGHGQVINQDRMEKMQQFVLDNVVEGVKSIVEGVKNRERDRRHINGMSNATGSKQNSQIAQVIDYMLEIFQFAALRQKNKSVQQILEQMSNNQNTNLNNNLSMGPTTNYTLTQISNGGSSGKIKYEYNSEGNVHLKNQRKMSEQCRQFNNLNLNLNNNTNGNGGSKLEWGEAFIRDVYGLQVVNKYERVMGMLDNRSIVTSLPNINL